MPRRATKKSEPHSNWDPLLLVAAILSLQALHYLTLSIVIPPLLALFAEPVSLQYEGGASNVGMVMDWREMCGRRTVRGLVGLERYSYTWSGGHIIGFSFRENQLFGSLGSSLDSYSPEGKGIGADVDPLRGWIIALAWLVGCAADTFYLYTLIRRPRLILDFVLTLVFIHFVLTSYYSSSIPTSLFFYLVTGIGALATISSAEYLCVRREMREGLKVSSSQQPNNQYSMLDQEEEDIELETRRAEEERMEEGVMIG